MLTARTWSIRALTAVVCGVLPALLIMRLFFDRSGGFDLYPWDFHVFWEAARDVAAGRSPYSAATVAELGTQDKFLYPPALAQVLIPLGLLPFWLASSIYAVASIGASMLALRLLGVRDWRCYGAMLLTPALWHGVQLGSLTPWLMLGLAAAWRWRHATFGPALALCAPIVAKLFLAPMVVWLLAQRRWRAAAALTLGTAAVIVVSWAAIGFAGMSHYGHMLSLSSDLFAPLGFGPMSLALALGLPSLAAKLVAVAAGGSVLAWGAHRTWRSGDSFPAFGAALTASLLLSPIVWMNYFAVLFVLVAVRFPRLHHAWFVLAIASLPLMADAYLGQSHESVWRICLQLAAAAYLTFACVRPARAAQPELTALPGSDEPSAALAASVDDSKAA